MKMCFNWKVLAGLGVVALGIYTVAPNMVASALPILLVLACPLSMILMGGMMGGMGSKSAQQNEQVSPSGEAAQYTCPMHSEVLSGQPGRCPTCGMALVPVTASRPRQTSLTEGIRGTVSREEQLASLRTQLQSVGEQQASLARQIEKLQTPENSPPTQALQEAEQVARAADKRQPRAP